MPPGAPALAAAAARVGDWERLLGLAAAHGLLGRLAALLPPAIVPPAARERLRRESRRSAVAGEAAVGHLAGLTRRFREAGLEVLPFKGPLLSAALFGEPGQRHFSDLDLLVRRTDAPRAASLLRGAGLVPAIPLTPRRERVLFGRLHDLTFLLPGGGLVVDLRWDLGGPYLASALGVDELLRRRCTLRVGETEFPSLAAGDLLLVLCLHGCKHRWDRLLLVADLAALLARQGEAFEWDAVLRTAARTRLRRALRVGLRLAGGLAAAAVPAGVTAALGEDPVAARLAGLARARLCGPPPAVRASRLDTGLVRERLLVHEHGTDRWRAFARSALLPNPNDWRALPLPDPLYPLYAAARPLRLAGGWLAPRLRASRARPSPATSEET